MKRILSSLIMGTMLLTSANADYFDMEKQLIKEIKEFGNFASQMTQLNKRMSTNIIETKEHYLFEIEMAGILKENIKIIYEEGVLNIFNKETIKKHLKEKKAKYILRERNLKDYTRKFRLKSEINIDTIKADLENGILYITIEKKEKKVISKRITIN